MIAKLEKVGCIYDAESRITHIIHWDEKTRTTRKYRVAPLGMEEEVEMFNNSDQPLKVED